MKKERLTKIYIIWLIWAAAFLQIYINSKINHEKYIVEEAMAIDDANLSSGCVTAYGFYGKEELSQDTRIVIAKNVALKLGITDDYSFDERSTVDGNVTVLNKRGNQADSSVKVITLNNGESYIYTEIKLKGIAAEAAYKYKVKLEKLYEDYGIDANTNMYLKEERRGRLTDEEESQMKENFLLNMNAKAVENIDVEDVQILYGYTKDIKEFVYQNDKKVNVNMAIKYDEENDITYIFRGIPFVDSSL